MKYAFDEDKLSNLLKNKVEQVMELSRVRFEELNSHLDKSKYMVDESQILDLLEKEQLTDEEMERVFAVQQQFQEKATSLMKDANFNLFTFEEFAEVMKFKDEELKTCLVDGETFKRQSVQESESGGSQEQIGG